MHLNKLVFIILINSTLSFSQATYGPEFELMGKYQMAVSKFCTASIGILPTLWVIDEFKSEYEKNPENKDLIPLGIISGLMIGGFGGVFAGFRAGQMCQKVMVNKNYWDLKHSIVKHCKSVGCKVHKVKVGSVRHADHDAFKVLYPDGFYFIIDKDLTAVEIQAMPMTLKDLKSKKAILQRDLFDVAESLGIEAYRSSDWLSQGHINIGRESAFGDDDLLLRNFIVDQLNHSELSSGVLSNDKTNADTPMRERSKRSKIEQLIQKFDDGEIKMKDFASELQNIYGGSMSFMSLNTLFKENKGKLKFEKSAQRVEIRAHRAQKNAEEFYLLAKMYENRIEYLKEFKSPIPFINKKPAKKMTHKFIAFKAYLQEMGLDPKDYQKIFPKRLCRQYVE